MKKSVTTIICHRNYEKYLKNALNSSINQTYEDNYTVLVDDNSGDIPLVEQIVGECLGEAKGRETFEDGAFVEAREKGMFISLKKTCGPSLARNIGMSRNTESDYFAILDADDEMMLDKIEKCVSIMENNQFICGVYADYIIQNDRGERRYEHKHSYSKALLERDCIIHSGSVLRKESLLQVLENGQIYDPSLRTCEDYDLWLRLSNVGIFHHIPEPLTLVRVHDNNSTSSVPKEVWEANYQRVKQKYYAKHIQHTK